ncbi:MAG: lipid-A-disaccharide synthase [bacterium]
MKKILFSAGEASGDLFASFVITEMLKQAPETKIIAFGGEYMKRAGAEIKIELTKLAFMGFVEVGLNILKVVAAYMKAVRILKKEKPDALVLVDYPGFNIKLMETAKKFGIKKIIYYSTPQVWAWHYERIKKIKKNCDLIINILPFEKNIFEKEGIRAAYFGHPLAAILGQLKDEKNVEGLRLKYGILPSEKAIGIFPGSRLRETKKFLPVLMTAAQIIKKEIPACKFFIFKADNIGLDIIATVLEKYPDVGAEIIGQTPDARRMLDCAIAKSGTITLELALLEVTEVIVYKLSEMSYKMLKKMAKIKYIGLVNLILDKPVIKELIQHDFTAEKVSEEVLTLLKNDLYKAQMLKDFKRLTELLEDREGAAKTSAIILKELA